MSTEIMFIHKLTFLVSISKGLKFTTIEYLLNISEISLVNSIDKIVSYYKSHSLHKRTIFVDLKLQLLEDKVVSTALKNLRA